MALMGSVLLAAAEIRPGIVHYLPIATTVIAVPFVGSLIRHYRKKGEGAHLLWWAAGVACYGFGTALESTVTLLGNSIALNKAWYIAGALLGAYPLAQGTVFLLLDRRKAMILTRITLPLVGLMALLVVLSPVQVASRVPSKSSMSPSYADCCSSGRATPIARVQSHQQSVPRSETRSGRTIHWRTSA